jgi:peptidyl-prolyl cis-trans isomerase D
MVPEFNDFIFGNPVGAKGVVKTEFGYHYVEVLSQKGSSRAYKVAYSGQPIVVSQETDQNASNAANEFTAEARDVKSFDEHYEKFLKGKGISKAIATDIKPTAYDIPGVGQSRTFVRNIYKAKKGEVLTPEKIGDNYIVAVVTEVFKEGTQSPAYARNAVEPSLRNRKKAEQFRKQVGNVTTLEAAATALGNKPIETLDSLRLDARSMGTFGYEPKIIGASFNPANKGKIIPEVFEGVSGVYIVRVDEVTATPVADANVANQQKTRYDQAKGSAVYNIPNALKKAATIKDNRANVY